MFIKFPLLPGVFKDDSGLAAKGYFIDSNMARASRNGMQSMKGYEQATTSTLIGVCRGMTSWLDNGGNASTFMGTDQRCHAFQQPNLYDITPCISRGQLTNPFTTDGTTAILQVAHTAHGLIANQAVRFPGVASVNGITLTAGALYAVTITSANAYTIVGDAVSTSAGSGVGGTVDYEYFLAPGLTDSAGGQGYGTGTYGSGNYGSPNTQTLYCRTWSQHNWGEEILFSPRGGAVYSLNPTGDGYNLTPAEQTTNGTFTGSSTGWTLGSNWAYGTNNITATAASTAFSQSITLRPACYYLIQVNVSAFTGGTLQGSLAGTNFGTAIAATGKYKVVVYSSGGGAQTLSFTAASATLTVNLVSVMQLNCGTVIANAPTTNTCMTVTSQRIVMVGGTVDANGNFDALLLKWSDQENYATWTAASTNQAGSQQLAEGGRIVSILNGNGCIYVFTDTALYVGQYTADTSLVYTFQLVGLKCGLIGANAAVVTDFGVFWLAPGGQAYLFNGSTPIPLQLPVMRDMFDNLQWVQNDKIVAFSNAITTEVGWLYSDQRDPGVEISRYILYNYAAKFVFQSYSPQVCTVGKIVRTFWIDQGIQPFALATDATGTLWYMEKGYSGAGGALTGYMQTGYFDAGDGDSLSLIRGLIFDSAGQQGGFSVTIYGRNFPYDTPKAYGPFNFTAASAVQKLRIRKREISLYISWTSAPFFMRLGAIRLDVEQTTVRRTRAA